MMVFIASKPDFSLTGRVSPRRIGDNVQFSFSAVSPEV
jgi:hypothetical protein